MPPEYALQVAFTSFMTGNVFSHKIISSSLIGGGVEMTPFLIKWGCKLPSSIIFQHNFLESSLFSLKTILSWLQREVRASESYLSRWLLMTKLQPHFNITGIDWGLSSIGMMPPNSLLCSLQNNHGSPALSTREGKPLSESPRWSVSEPRLWPGAAWAHTHAGLSFLNDWIDTPPSSHPISEEWKANPVVPDWDSVNIVPAGMISNHIPETLLNSQWLCLDNIT